MRRLAAFGVFVSLLSSSITFAQQQTPSSLPPGNSKKFELRVATDVTIQNYSLEGTGFTTSDGATDGRGLSADFFWRRSENTWRVQYQTLKYAVTAPTGLSPSAVDSQFERILLNYEMNNNSLSYELGLDSRTRKATATAPNVFMPNQTRTGLRLGIHYGNSFDSVFRYEFGAGLMLPLVVNETSVSTGSYRYSLNPDLNFDFIYKVNPLIDFSLGIHWLMERTSYAGTGARGVSGATETFNNFIFPIELRFQF